MRLLASCALAFLAVACAKPQPSALTVPPPDQRAGCIDTSVTDCMLSLAGAMSFDADAVGRELQLRRELDVNGRPARRTIGVTATFPGHVEPVDLVLRLAPEVTDDRVIKVAATLPRDPTELHTVRQYDEAYLYDTVSTLLGRRCLSLDKLQFYQFFENQVKPRMVSETRVERPGIFSHTIVRKHSDRVPYCGAVLSFASVTEWDGELMSKSMPSLRQHAVIALE
jgi:hypothetical protein